MASRTSPVTKAEAGRRRHSRLRVHLPAKLITLSGTLTVTLSNLSYSGAKVMTGARPVARGASAVLTWGTFEAFCTVAWAQGDYCGLDFDEPLRSEVLIATRDLGDITPRLDANRAAAREWAAGRISRL